MIVGTLEMRLLIRESRSLKDKRKVVSSIKNRIQSSFNVSIAELDQQDRLQTAVIGVAVISNQRRHAQQTLDRVLKVVRTHPIAQLIDYVMEV